MDRIDALRLFVEVVEAGSFSAVARQRLQREPGIGRIPGRVLLARGLVNGLLVRKRLVVVPELRRQAHHAVLDLGDLAADDPEVASLLALSAAYTSGSPGGGGVPRFGACAHAGQPRRRWPRSRATGSWRTSWRMCAVR
mgnify:CR=1 FL=1